VCALIGALSAIFLSPRASRAQTPAGTQIVSITILNFVGANGLPYNTADTLTILVGQMGGADVVPPRSVVTDPSTTVTFAHTVSNIGNALDGVSVSAVSRSAWATRVYLDVDKSGTLTAGDLLLASPIPLAMGASASVLVQEDVPASAVRGSTDSIDVRATSSFDPTANDVIVDATNIRAAGIRVDLAKSVDHTTTTVGDVVTYTISYVAVGAGTATGLVVRDTIPAGTTYVPGTLRLKGQALTDASDVDAGFFDGANNVVSVAVGNVAAGQNGTVSFQARVNNVPAQYVITNVANSSYGTPIGPDSSISAPVQSTSVLPQIALDKQLVGPTSAHIGQLVQYRIRYTNGAPNVFARSVVVVDTLAAGLDYVSAVPAATVAGSVLTWNMGDQSPSTTTDILLTVRVAPTVQDTVNVRNGVGLSGRNVASESATASTLQMIGTASYSLSLVKRADVIEAGMGESVPYTLIVQNTGTAPVSGIRIHDHLPPVGRYATRSAIGADSVEVAVGGHDIMIFVRGTLAPGATATLRYAVAIVGAAKGKIMVNSAYASAENESVLSPRVTASVNVRESMPMETRTAFGKVWADLDGDGKQDAGEPGIEGVDVWTDDGDVATTDKDGRYSFHNLRPGRHSFRVDRASVPTGFGFGSRAAEQAQDVAVRDASGWTTPRIDFGLVASGGRLVGSRAVKTGELVTSYLCPHLEMRPAKDVVTQQGAPLATDSAKAAQSSDRPECEPADTSCTLCLPIDSASARLVAQHADARTRAEDFPDAGKLPAESDVDVVLQPPFTGWPGEGTIVLPNGWAPVSGSSFFGKSHIADPTIGRDRTGARTLTWSQIPGQFGLVSVRLHSLTATRVADSARIASLRTAEDRAAEKRASLTRGEGIEIFAPHDGVVMSSDHVYVGVRGEPGRPVALYDGDSLVANATMRVDGVFDFIAVRLARGPHRLRVRLLNSLNTTRWDSVAVHVSGLPARFEADRPKLRLQADGNTIDSVRVHVLDSWGVPVVGGVLVTVSAEGATPANVDADASSVGVQVRADESGTITVLLRPGHEVRRSRLTFVAGDARGELPIDILPVARPLMLTGVGRVGLGASPDAFASLTAKGRLDDQTSLTLSYDTRRLDAGRDAFARTRDPLEESQYPILGDASLQRAEAASRYALSAKVERGFDWVQLGDVTTSEFASGLETGAYRRSFSGVATRLTTASGGVVVQGFGSSTAQAVHQMQIRGEGVSGPYILALGMVAGTDHVVLETRAIDNAQRVVSRQELVRFVDYQIDYENGTLLLKQPLPATDVYGNPVYIVATFEADGGGARSTVWGARASADAARYLSHSSQDTLRLGAMWVQDGQATGVQHLAGLDLRAAWRGWIDVGGELTHSQNPDSSGVAAAAHGSLKFFGDALTLRGTWMQIGNGFANPANLTMQSGTEETNLGAKAKFGATELRLEHEEQRFDAAEVSRGRTLAGVVQSLPAKVKIESDVVNDRYTTTSATDGAMAGEMKVTWTPLPSLDLYSDGRRAFETTGSAVQPDFVGAGATYRILPGVSLEARHRQVFLGGDSANYSITNLGVRSRIGDHSEAWSSYQIAGANGEYNAAIVGLNNQFRFSNGLTLNASAEHREGVGHASIADPVRALPFLQNEEDYTAFGVGAELLPSLKPYRLSARGEYRDGTLRSVRLLDASGDMSFARSLALLQKTQYTQTSQSDALSTFSRSMSTMTGLAFRPIGGDALNALAKIEYVNATNPLTAGVLTTRGDEARTILALETVWAPTPVVEVATRYATRRTAALIPQLDGTVSPQRSTADYIGNRLGVDITPWLAARTETRLLLEHASSTARWDAAPQLAFSRAGLEAAVGYRIGDLRDPDFSVNGGPGWFITFGAKVTERSAKSVAEFWRARQ
jgi:uncharacterized repeat protein (TIGR01451 family)/fimbrial isopeptide formation D2 family protein